MNNRNFAEFCSAEKTVASTSPRTIQIHAAILLLSFLALGKAQAEGTKCDDPAFGGKFAAYSALDTGKPSLAGAAMLAVVNGKDSVQYKKIEHLAAKDKVFADLKSYVDLLQAEQEKAFAKSREFTKLSKDLRKKYDKAFGSDWDNNPRYKDIKLFDKFTDELDKVARERGLSTYKENQTSHPHPHLKSFNEATESELARRSPQMKSVYMALTQFAENYVEAGIEYERIRALASQLNFQEYSKNKVNERKFRDARFKNLKEDLKQAGTRYEGSLSKMVSATEIISESRSPSEKHDFSRSGRMYSAAGGGLLAVLGSGAVSFLSARNAEAAVHGCQKSWGLGTDEIRKVAMYVDGRSAPAILDTKVDCDSLKLNPGALVGLRMDTGELSGGVCQKLVQQFTEMSDRYNKPFDLEFSGCEEGHLTVGGEPVGKFVQVDATHYYFEIPPQKRGMAMKFHIQYNGGLDFDPQAIDCIQKTGDSFVERPNCSSTVKDALRAGSLGGYINSIEGAREKLFHAKKSCKAIGTPMYAEPLCKFAENTEQIRQGFSLIAAKCLTGGGRGQPARDTRSVKGVR